MVEQELNDNYKNIMMLNMGSQNLDQILAMGRVNSQHRGLGYQGRSFSFGNTVSEPIAFGKECRPMEGSHNDSVAEKRKNDKRVATSDRKAQGTHGYVQTYGQTSLSLKRITSSGIHALRFRGCYHCGKMGHIREKCYKLKTRLQLLWNLRKCWLEPSGFGSV